MRILILTHGRSGGMTLSTWIANELTHEIIHEPNLTNPTIKCEVLTKNNIIVKVIPEDIKTDELNVILDSFDKVIVHKRDNTLDVACSIFYAEEKKPSDKRMHDTYEFDDKWKEENKDIIESINLRVKKLHNILDNISHSNIIKTSYESIYYDNKDVIKICDYINISNPMWLDIIDNKRRLRNGNIGMNNLTKKIVKIKSNKKII
jgi:hypothetical protein